MSTMIPFPGLTALSTQTRSEHASTIEPAETDCPFHEAENARLHPRSSMFLSALMIAGREQSPVKVRNMSPTGAMLESTLTTPPGARIKLVRGRLLAEGTTVWTSRNRHGVRFDVEVSVKDWLAGPAKVEQDRVDDIVSLIKAGRVMPQMGGAEPGIDTEARQSDEQSANDIKTVVNLILDLEDDLASSAETLMRHEAKLQNLDIAMQMLRAIAQQLSCGPRDQPSSSVNLNNLRVACGQALGGRLA